MHTLHAFSARAKTKLCHVLGGAYLFTMAYVYFFLVEGGRRGTEGSVVETVGRDC